MQNEGYQKDFLNNPNGEPIISHGSLGWVIRKVISSENGTVMLDDGVSFNSPCFKNALNDQIWAVKHESGIGCFGKIEQAVLLER